MESYSMYNFCVCLSLIIILRSIWVVYINDSFFFMVEQYSIVWLYHYLFIHSHVDVHLSYVPFGDITIKLL